MNRDLGYLVQT